MCRTKEGGSSSKFYGMHIPSICPFLQQRKEDGEIVQFSTVPCVEPNACSFTKYSLEPLVHY